MPLLSDRQSFDRLAGIRAQAGIDSQQGNGWTIEYACERLEYPMPVSEDDLKGFVQVCETWGIRTNLDDESWFKTMRKGE